jgi:hypothetical protein
VFSYYYHSIIILRVQTIIYSVRNNIMEFDMVGCMDRISHTDLKNRMVFSRIATSKNHIEPLVPRQI